MKINKNGYWENKDKIGHHNDEILLDKILNFIKDQNIISVCDFGCGTAYYISEIKRIINIDCEAYDGNPNTEVITNGFAKVLDLTQNFQSTKKFDLVLSLEVGEHIPKEYEEIFIENLVNNSNKYIILSWATVGQLGDGHINCQNNDYIISKMKNKKFDFLEDETINFRNSNLKLWWFKNTIMIFKKN